MNLNKVSIATRTILIVSAIMLGISIFVPIWRIELDAPQYPEGLALLIFSNKLGGDVEIINGLNHYIGMQTLHAENFIEFTLLPYIIGGFAILMLLSAIVGRKILLYTTFISFALFGILAMVDFYRWNYNYGHNLDPHAAIIVPGMAYQPPLIGYKQLLNFGAYSIPDIGGWLFIAAAVLLMMAVFLETGSLEKLKKFRAKRLPLLAFSLLLVSCNQQGPVPIKLHNDACNFCKMTIAEGRFAAELITDKGKVFKFDDLSCMIRFLNENKNQVYTQKYINDYTKNNILIDAESALFIYSPNVRSPMRGDVASFAMQEDADKHSKMWNAPILKWNQLNSVIE
ncbi:MAG: nitrous oxide reductase accessory protein NosL [Bacteroidia bacterium]|jgi:copper chaperone NosL|nr:nitrous oxide reductase accessory protein NosL [Bacteroidia bacterium]